MIADTSDAPIDGTPRSLGGTVENATGVGTVAWKAYSGSGTMSFGTVISQYPTVTFSPSGASNYLKVTNFGFGSYIPAAATIRGVMFRVTPLIAVGSIEEARARIVLGGVIKGTVDRATPGGGTNWYWNSPQVRVFGLDAYDLWGQSSISRSEVVATNFGFALALETPAGEIGETRSFSVERVDAIVAYSEAANENRVCFAGRSLIFSDSGNRRQHATDETWGDVPAPVGVLLKAPAPGQADRDARLLVIPSVGDFDTRADSADVSLGVKVGYRAGYLHCREAIEDGS
jgi:hypothetical protein